MKIWRTSRNREQRMLKVFAKVGKVRRVYIFWKSCLTNEFWLIWLSLNASRVFSRIRKTSSEIKRYINKVEILVPKDAKRKSEQRCQIRASRSLRWFLRDREKKINLFSSSKEISNNLYFLFSQNNNITYYLKSLSLQHPVHVASLFYLHQV